MSIRQTRAVQVERNQPACCKEEHASLCVIIWFLCKNQQNVLYIMQITSH